MWLIALHIGQIAFKKIVFEQNNKLYGSEISPFSQGFGNMWLVGGKNMQVILQI